MTKGDKAGSRKPPHDSPSILREIRLAGFQVFEDLTRFTFGPITLLYGPNSSGKSALQDALVLLEEALRIPHPSNPRPSFDIWARDRFPTLEPSWRRIGKDEENLSPVLRIGFTVSFYTNLEPEILASLPDSACWQPKEYHPNELSLDLIYRLEPNEPEGPFARRDLHIDLDSFPLLRLEELKRFGLNLAHPLLAPLRIHVENSLKTAHPQEVIVVETDWVWVNLEATLTEHRKLDREGFFYGWHNGQFTEIEVTENIRSLVLQLAEIFDELHLVGCSTGNTGLSTDFVPASRGIPSPSDLRFTITDHVYLTDLQLHQLRKSGLVDNTARPYLSLAESALSHEFGTRSFNLTEAQLFSGVNKALSGALFLEQGYQVAAEFHAIIGVHDLGELENVETSDVPQWPIRAQLFLVDANGRHLSLEDVGSGIGYVLPVLCSLADPEAELCLIQQPELHLHPALQAAMGDVFIEAYTGLKKQIVIETHSEHLLLRLLRRIRQTEKGKTANPEVKLLAGNVSVLYFEPQSTGTTSVRQLRVSPDGDFLDPWPKGFFAERDQELFDE